MLKNWEIHKLRSFTNPLDPLWNLYWANESLQTHSKTLCLNSHFPPYFLKSPLWILNLSCILGSMVLVLTENHWTVCSSPQSYIIPFLQFPVTWVKGHRSLWERLGRRPHARAVSHTRFFLRKTWLKDPGSELAQVWGLSKRPLLSVVVIQIGPLKNTMQVKL